MINNRMKSPTYKDLEPHKEKIIELFSQGIGSKKIGHIFGVGYDKIQRVCRRWGLDTSRGKKSKCPNKRYKDIPYCFWSSFKNGATQRGIEFNISIEEIYELLIEQNYLCKMTGRKLIFDSYRRQFDGNA